MSLIQQSQLQSQSHVEEVGDDIKLDDHVATQGNQGYQGNDALSTDAVRVDGHSAVPEEENANEQQVEEEQELTCKSCCKMLLGRNWFIIFFGALLGFDVGFIIYFFTGYAQWIWACTILGFLFAFIVDEYCFSAGRNRDGGIEIAYVQDSDVEKTFEIEEGCDFYVQTDIFSRFLRRYRGSARVYRKSNSGSLIFERKYVFFFKDYQGFEIGAGAFNLFSTILMIFVVIWLAVDFDVGAILLIIIFFAVVIFFTFIGGALERYLRSIGFLSPVNGSLTVSTPVPIHEIRDIQCISIGYHSHKSNLVKQRLGLFYIFVLWYRMLVYIGRFLLYCCGVIRINVVFFLWLLVFLFTFLLFLVVIYKDDPALLEATLAGIWVIFFFHVLFLAFLHTPFCGKKDTVRCGNSCTLPKFSIARLPFGTQTSFFYVLLISGIFVLIAALSLSVLEENIYHQAENFFTEAEQSVIISERLVCDEGNGSGRRRLATLPEELCDSPHKELLIVAVVCMCVSWNILLFLAFWWFMVDQYFSLRRSEEHEIKEWYKYTELYITRARNRKYQLLSPKIVIQLGEEQALELMTYLTKVCPYAQLPTTIGLSYDGGFQYVNRFGAIGGQPFGNGGGDGRDGGDGGRGGGGGGYHNVSSLVVNDGRR